MAPPIEPATRLMYELAGTAERRAARAPVIEELLAHADYDRLWEVMSAQAVLGVLGARAESTAGDALSAAFRERVQSSRARTSQWALVIEAVTRRLAACLEAEGIPAVAIKGVFMATELHGDPGRRFCGDVDLLVDRLEFRRALEVLSAEGWISSGRTGWLEGLPLFEATLEASGPWLPPLDLHWRLHWYELAFSRDLITRSRPPGDLPRRPSPIDELVALLLFFARDGFWGLRLAIDISAWWDVHGAQVEPGALDRVVRDYPQLERAVRTAAEVAERTVGLPAAHLLTPAAGATRNGGGPPRAARLASWSGAVAPKRFRATEALVDCLLTPPMQRRSYVRRHFLPPGAVIDEMYGLSPSSRIRRLLRRAGYASIQASIYLPWQVRALWRIRGRRELDPLPR